MNTPRGKLSLSPRALGSPGFLWTCGVASPPGAGGGAGEEARAGAPGHAAHQAPKRLPRNLDGKSLQNPAIPTVPIYSWETEPLQTGTGSSTCSKGFHQSLLLPSHGRHSNTARGGGGAGVVLRQPRTEPEYTQATPTLD